MRVRCKLGEQRAFIERVLRSTTLRLWELGEACGVSRRTISSWRAEDCHASLEGLEALSRLTGVPLPEFVEVISDEEWRKRRNTNGAFARMTKGPFQTVAGRNQGGKVSQQRRREHPELYPHILVPNIITIPPINRDLAEFVGIMLGDGGLTPLQVTVSLNPHEELEYADYVKAPLKITLPVAQVTAPPTGSRLTV